MDFEFELEEKEKEKERPLQPITIQEFLTKPQQNPSFEGKTSFDLADVIYIFYDKEKPGIRFYDRSPSGAEVEASSLISGVFMTGVASISVAQWDEKLNSEAVQLVKVREGDRIERTIMISEQEFLSLLKHIDENMGIEGLITIDLRNALLNQKVEEYQNPKLNTIDDFSNMQNKQEIDIEQYKSNDLNKVDLVDFKDNFNKKM